MKVENMKSSKGNDVPNQFIISDVVNEMSGNAVTWFQSYKSVIAKVDCFRAGVEKRQIWLDESTWDYSKTTAKYRNQFLGMTTKEITEKIENGEIILTNLNK